MIRVTQETHTKHARAAVGPWNKDLAAKKPSRLQGAGNQEVGNSSSYCAKCFCRARGQHAGRNLRRDRVPTDCAPAANINASGSQLDFALHKQNRQNTT